MIIETSIILFVIVQTIIAMINKKKTVNKNNYEKYKLIDIINSNLDDENIDNNIIKLMSYYNYEGHILLTRVKNDLIRNKQFRLNKQLFDKIRCCTDRNTIKMEITAINNRMHIYKYKLNNIFIRLKNDINMIVYQ
jgi:hypothetical protein